MPQPKKAARFGNSASHHNMMMANLATELIRHGRIRTTHAKAKTMQPLAERMITFAKRGDVHSRRQVLRVIRDKDVVHKLFVDVGPAFAQRDGGYTRVLKLGPRKGDSAMMALIELVEGVDVAGEGELEEAPRRRWSLRRSRGTQSTAARERTEERAAATDRGQDPDDIDVEAVEEVDEPGSQPAAAAVTPEGAPAQDLTADQADAAVEPAPGVTADPAEVEARLAAEDEATASDDDAAVEAERPAGDDDEAPDADSDDADSDDDR